MFLSPSFSYRLPVLAMALLVSACSQPIVRSSTVGLSDQVSSGAVASTLYDYELRSAGDQPLGMGALLNEIADADVVMVGEWHAHPGVHLFQARLMAALLGQEQPLSLSMEHFTRADQAELSRYLAGDIGESSLIKNTKAWDNYKSDYRPLVEMARLNKLPVIAANAPRDLVKCVGKEGPAFLTRLPAELRALVALDVDISDSPYRQKFLGNMSGMKLSEERIAKMFGAQMTWDATMAESIARHLEANPGRKVLHVAGRFHVADGLGTGAEILKLQPQVKIAYISPVVDEQAEGEEQAASSDYRLGVSALPPLWVNDDERNAVYAGHKPSLVDCEAIVSQK